jgi:hypothetical protein
MWGFFKRVFASGTTKDNFWFGATLSARHLLLRLRAAASRRSTGACEPANKRYVCLLSFIYWLIKRSTNKSLLYFPTIKQWLEKMLDRNTTPNITLRRWTLDHLQNHSHSGTILYIFSASQCRYKIKRLCNATTRCGCCLLLFFRLGCWLLCHQKVAGCRAGCRRKSERQIRRGRRRRAISKRRCGLRGVALIARLRLELRVLTCLLDCFRDL